MKLRIDTIPEEGQDLQGQIEPAEISLDVPGYTLHEPVEFSGHASKTEDDVYVEGVMHATIDAVCSRCLEDMKVSLDFEMNVLYVPKQQLPEEGDGTVEPESNVAFYVGDTIDLGQELRDVLVVNLPIKAVCKPDCKGLCSFCGQNLNVSECECQDSPAGSPFEKLVDLRKRMQGQ